jgi:hypothetical protein
MSSNSIADQLKNLGYPQAHFASKDGQMGIIPADQVEQAKSAGYEIHEPATYMTDPSGKLGLVPRSQAKAALDKGYKVGQPLSTDAKVIPQAHPIEGIANQALGQNPKSQNIGVSSPENSGVEPQYVQPLTGAPKAPTSADKYLRPLNPLHPIEAVGQAAGALNEVRKKGAEDIRNYIGAEAQSMNPNDPENRLSGVHIASNPYSPAVDLTPEQTTGAYQNIVAPLGQAGADQLEGLSDPKMAPIIAATQGLGANSALARTAQRAAQGYFAQDMARGAADQVVHGVEAAQQGNTPEAVRALANAAASGAMAGDTARGLRESAPGTVQDARDSSTAGVESLVRDRP